MLQHAGIYGKGLPERTVCLTYDDGPGETVGSSPGPRTSELGRYLHDEGIRATFFVIGRHVEQYPASVERLHHQGHLVGNHTYSHPGLVRFVLEGGDAGWELRKTQELIAPYVNGGPVYFRPPYGNWREKSDLRGPEDAAHSVVAAALNGDDAFANYVGPVLWDIVAEDWECWRNDLPPDECAQRYLAEAERVGRGIVLMHDSSAEDDLRPKNRTLELSQRLVPMLKQRGFRFAALDDFVK
ncbi:MAG TPA: polysaccharide deacetylase family protein [Pirellulales bacterium]|nr:polysaccharide deacetylase family protein [Pirellulales bacterium]